MKQSSATFPYARQTGTVDELPRPGEKWMLMTGVMGRDGGKKRKRVAARDFADDVRPCRMDVMSSSFPVTEGERGEHEAERQDYHTRQNGRGQDSA